MKIVYLIIAHNNPGHLDRLVSSLQDRNASFVIHIDSRVNSDEFQRFFVGRSDIYFVSERAPSAWGSFAIIEAILNGLEYIIKNLTDCKRIVLVGGRDYPIKSTSYIYSFFTENPKAIFLEYFKLPHQRWQDGGILRFPNFESVNESIEIFGGSLWLSFPTNVAVFIFQFLEFNPDFVAYFRTVSIPYESFFQTLFLNCGEAFILDNLVNNHLRFVEWDIPYLYTKVLKIKDHRKLGKSKSLFAGKFDSIKQSELLDLIDRELLGTSNFYANVCAPSNRINIKSQAQCIVYLTHKNVKSCLNEYKKLQKAANSINAELKLLIHEKAEALQEDIVKKNPFIYDDSILPSLSYKSTQLKGGNHFPLLMFYLQNNNHDYYWYIEDDVYYNAPWEHFFNFFTDNNISSDFITCNIKDYESEPDWQGWDTLSHPEYVVRNQSKIRSFNPIFRISNRALNFFHQALSNGWSGHDEVLLPTLLKENGFLINDFGGEGQYVLPGCINRFYRSDTTNLFGSLVEGTVRFKSPIGKEKIKQHLLYHPVKIEDISDQQKLHTEDQVIFDKKSFGISVIMPTYNQCHYIRRAIISLFSQTYKNWELIIINDGSTDDTEIFISEFLNHQQVTYIKNLKNRGLGFSLNQGLDKAKNDYIAYLPSDDYYYNNHLELIANAFRNIEQPIFIYTRAKSEIIDSFGGQRVENEQANGIFNKLGIQLVQAAHKNTTERWLVRATLVTANLADMFWRKISSLGKIFHVKEITCNWSIHPFQRHKMIEELYGGSLHKYKHYYGVESPLKMDLGRGKLIDEIEQYKNFRTPKCTTPKHLKILMVGELSYNHDRILAFEDRECELYGLWASDLASWANTGPLPFGNIINIPYANWRQKVKEIEPDIIYAQLNHGAINLAHEILVSKLNIPFVWHFKEGPSVAVLKGKWDKLIQLYQHSDGKIFINPEAEAWYSQFIPFGEDDLKYILDGDLAKADYFMKQLTPKLSESDGCIHTVVVGRMIGISLEMIQKLASSNIHIHAYLGNSTPFHDEALKLAPNHFHIHSFCQAKDWAKELSRYNAAWLHCIPSKNNGNLTAAGWDDLNLPCRISTYAAAGLPIIQLRNQGHVVAARNYLHSKNVGIFFDSCDDLIQQLHNKRLITKLNKNMHKIRMTFSFDYHVEGLIKFFKQVIQKKKEAG